MGLLNQLSFLRGFRRSPQSPQSPQAPQAPPGNTSVTPPPQPQLKTLAELEREIEAQYNQLPHRQSRLTHSTAKLRKAKLLSKLVWAGVWVGIPIGSLWLINQPYPSIRRPIARHASVLLMPSYISMDHHYRQAISLVQQATQLIDQATAPDDIDLGAQKVEQAQASLDQLPLWIWDELPGYRYGWSGRTWRMSYSGFNTARAEIGRLQAKAFQERNAQTALFNAEQALDTAKQQYQQAKTITDKQNTIVAWRSVLNQLEQISTQTLAGRMAQQRLSVYQHDFQDTVGLAADNAQVAIQIEAARQFAWQAAQMGQNPPHSVEYWQQVEKLWQEAIERLKQVPLEDLAGYAEAQRLLAEYQTNLGQIQVRKQTEQQAVAALQLAKHKIQALQASLPNHSSQLDRSATISQLQSIIDQLETVESGTTDYANAQMLLVSAKNKLNQLQQN